MALFDEQTYLKNKAAQLNATGFEGKKWDAQSVKSAFSDSGLSAQQHYQQYGKKEGVTPYNIGNAPRAPNTSGKLRTNQFDTNNYLNNKALQLNQQQYGGKKDWTPEQARLHMLDSGMTPEEHYQKYGRAEGVDPYVYQPGITSAPSYSASTRSINPATDTVQGQITGLLDKNNPYMQRARARGMSTANSRGLLNSTMAGQASEAAAIDAALPIASQDADSYLRQGLTNQQYQNQALRDNANFALSTGQFNAEYGQRMDLAQMDDARAREMQQEEIGFGKWSQQQNDTLKRDLAQMDRDMQEYIAGIETGAQTKQQFIESSNELMQQYQIQYRETMTNPNMTPEAREQSIEALKKMYNTGMELSADMLGVPVYFDDAGDPNRNIIGIGQQGAARNGLDETGQENSNATPPQDRAGNNSWLAQGGDEVSEKIRTYQTSSDPLKKFTTTYNPKIEYFEPENHVNHKAHNTFARQYGTDGNLYMTGEQTLPQPQDIGQTPPPDDGSFQDWIKSPASKLWRYKNPDMAVSSGGKRVEDKDLSALEKQVYRSEGIENLWDWYYR